MIEALLQAERLLTVGLLDEAEELFRRAAQADPLNAIAVVGLARVASERGDDRAAYEQAVAALAIDPDNALALRLEARLSEMLAARGETVERPPWILADSSASAAEAARPTAPPGPAPNGPADPGRAAQRAAFTRNPSMADHQRRMEAQDAEPDTEPPTDPAPAAKPRGLLRRLMGR